MICALPDRCDADGRLWTCPGVPGPPPRPGTNPFATPTAASIPKVQPVLPPVQPAPQSAVGPAFGSAVVPPPAVAVAAGARFDSFRADAPDSPVRAIPH